MEKNRKKDGIVCISVLVGVTVGSFAFQRLSVNPSILITMLHILGIFLVARYTSGYLWGFLFAFVGVASVNFFFMYPYKNIDFTIDGYKITYLFMVIIAAITSALTTNMKKQAHRLAEQEKELAEAQKEKMRANLLRAVSHDIRTPLTGIIGSSTSYLEMENDLTNEEKHDLILNIKEDANWLLNMVENLLSVTRIDNETAKVNKSLEAVDEVASSAVIRFKKRFPDAKVKVVVPEHLIMVMMDAMLIEQVIINILQNAQFHSNSREPLELIIDEDSINVYFHIKDHGIGIEEDSLDSIFDGAGYSKGKQSESDSYKGMGIGLSICKTIVMAHDGQIGAFNHEDGAELWFSLPKEKEQEDDAENNCIGN